MPSSVWKRFSVRQRNQELDEVLVDGVPEWLVQPLWVWALGLIKPVHEQFGGDSEQSARLLALQVAVRVRLNFSQAARSAIGDLASRCGSNPDFFLEVLDYLLAAHADVADANELDSVLAAGGSAWTIAEQTGPTPNGRVRRHWSLVRRVDHTVDAAAKSAVTSAPRAGDHLAAAWASAYGRKPDATAAYREAVRAVEVAILPVISPKNPKGTLGQAISDMENGAASSKYTMVLQPGTNFPPMDAVIAMCRLLWTAQRDRHGTADPNVPMSVSIEQARAAVHLAATLVQWFATGVVVNQRP